MKSQKVEQVRRERESASGRTAGTIRLSPRQVLAGICFHLRDEGLVTSITTDSVRRTELRLARERLELSVSRERWECMDHKERLNWLMAESHTVMSLAPGGVATLHRNDEA
jgi:hypothetical protein